MSLDLSLSNSNKPLHRDGSRIIWKEGSHYPLVKVCGVTIDQVHSHLELHSNVV